METCSEINYNNGSGYYDEQAEMQSQYACNQQWQNGDSYGYDSQGYSVKKALPQPPMSYSQSVNDVYGHR